ncbi:hypothetical protein [Halomonas sp.]|uniref:hypothetical protein n=1 Tax=unclassified Halomonas TaxID=2609666 RepID=UPI003F9E67FB
MARSTANANSLNTPFQQTIKRLAWVSFALLTVLTVDTRPAQIVFGLMFASWFITMRVSNTATAVIRAPIGVSIIALVNSLGKYAGPSNAALVDRTVVLCAQYQRPIASWQQAREMPRL